VGVYHFITTQTVLGRHIYAVGGNPEAAELSGISVKKITYVVFGSMGFSGGALSGILFTSRLQSATTTAGTLFELDAIAAAFVGGVSAAGGVGTIIGSLIGALVMASLQRHEPDGRGYLHPVHRKRLCAGAGRHLRRCQPPPRRMRPGTKLPG
jgi:putative multiple sugar transport system permease protein